MTTKGELVPVSAAQSSALTTRTDLADEVKRLTGKARSRNTVHAHKADLKVFEEWCGANGGLSHMPATEETAVAFLTDQSRGPLANGHQGAPKAYATVRRYRSTLDKAHGIAGFPSPFKSERVATLMEGIARDKGIAHKNAKAPLDATVAAEAVGALPTGDGPAASLILARDRAILLVGLASAMRRSELCALNMDDVARVKQGYVLHIRSSKTDQQGAGRTVGIPRMDDPSMCPAAALEAWLSLAGITSGPVFRGVTRWGKVRAGRLSSGQVGAAVKRAVAAAGLDPAKFGGHSLRSGYVTTARAGGFAWETIMEQTGHRRVEQVKAYARGKVDPFKMSAVREVFRRFSDSEE